MKPRSEAARILAGYGVTVSELARRTGRSRQAVSRHLAGETADLPEWLFLAMAAAIDQHERERGQLVMVGHTMAHLAATAAHKARQERRNE